MFGMPEILPSRVSLAACDLISVLVMAILFAMLTPALAGASVIREIDFVRGTCRGRVNGRLDSASSVPYIDRNEPATIPEATATQDSKAAECLWMV